MYRATFENTLVVQLFGTAESLANLFHLGNVRFSNIFTYR